MWEVAVDADPHQLSASPLSQVIRSTMYPLMAPSITQPSDQISSETQSLENLSLSEGSQYTLATGGAIHGTGQSHGKLMRKICTAGTGTENSIYRRNFLSLFYLSDFLTQSYEVRRFSLYFYQYNEIMINIPDNREAAADTYHGFSRILSRRIVNHFINCEIQTGNYYERNGEFIHYNRFGKD